MSRHKILFACSEIHPLIKTGGLGDVAGSLPPALKAQRQDVRIIMPAYREAMRRVERLNIISLQMEGVAETVRLLEGRLPGSSVKLWLVDSPNHFDRPGNPYIGSDGHDWHDNAERFATFAQVVSAVARNRAGIDWQPDIVHCNDWQTGLVPALLSRYPDRPATLFTIHNLAYHGHFDAAMRHEIALPDALWGIEGVEFHGGLSFIKGGLAFADMVNTVSPTYAQEILTPAFGYGLEGLLQHRADRLVGILNGVNYREWDPDNDPHLSTNFNSRHLEGKAANKAALQASFNLPIDSATPLLGMVGRLVEQKGIDLILDALPAIMQQGAQVVAVGSGNKVFEEALRDAAATYPKQMATFIGFSETLAHQVEAGSDIFLMPSRFEPCGLNQLYSLRYGAVPIVSHTGGLADSVTDATPENIKAGKATGFHLRHITRDGLLEATQQALTLYREHPSIWRRIVTTGMRQEFSWKKSAKEYLALYQQALQHKNR